MLTRRHLAKLAFILIILLTWTQQLVAAHGVVHPWHDGSTQKQAPGSHSQLCDLCVVSALDSAPLPNFNLPAVTSVPSTFIVVAIANLRLAPPRCYLSRAPPLLA
ncbi:hypothetical protein [Sulfuriferula nivalis]|uniref:hypothetical protein n=1 Tax=Sulfuriferula nivalis TaxID=2675298 RepID=UPI00138A5D5E|nr:hypothetical protein [Sulfuriferula nivalis]